MAPPRSARPIIFDMTSDRAAQSTRATVVRQAEDGSVMVTLDDGTRTTIAAEKVAGLLRARPGQRLAVAADGSVALPAVGARVQSVR